ncbi:hypothetical protein ACHHYP_13744 [Achlya hypogyna]|uniref:Uncharacterized protein n=1 Tax=Achlya hypogyna TaxID=1202772 RepID=A0A1V9YER4_ACHHY|nr:hypothetical protein ACHHYP_13744 [Achlya hypogyna]
MSVAWPVNRLSYEAIADEDHALIDRLFAGRCDEPRVAKWVQQCKGQGSFARRLASKTKVAKDLPLLDLLKLQVEPSAQVPTLKLVFKAGRVLLLDPGVHCEDIVRTLQRSLSRIARAFSPSGQPKVKLIYPFMILSLRVSTTAKLFSLTPLHRAHADMNKAPFRAWIAEKLEENAAGVLDVTACLLAGGDGETADKARDALAVVSTCRNAQSFRGLVVYDVAMDDVGLSRAFQTLEHNAQLTECVLVLARLTPRRLRLTKVRLSRAGLHALEEVVLAKGQQAGAWALATLDLSENKLSRDMVTTLAASLKLFPTGLQRLLLGRCHIANVVPIVAIFALPSWAATLQELNLSFNTLDAEGTAALTEWLGRAFSLRRLAVAGTGVDTLLLLRALKLNTVLHSSSLTELDLSHSALKDDACADLGHILGATASLSSLVLRRLAVPRRGFHGILAPWFQNAHLSAPLQLDASENDFSGARGSALAKLLAASPRVQRDSLRLNRCGLRDEALAAVVAALATASHLRELHLENNGGRALSMAVFFPAALEPRPGDAFASLLTSARQLRELYLRSDEPALRYPLAVLRPVLHALGAATSALEVLDLSGNRGGDEVAACLAAALPKTLTLRALFWDGNYTTLAGFERFHAGLALNRSVTVMPVPVHDTRRLLEQREPDREGLFAVLGALYGCIQRNQAARDAVAASVVIRDDVGSSYDGAALWRSALLRSTATDLRQSWSAAVAGLDNTRGDAREG